MHRRPAAAAYRWSHASCPRLAVGSTCWPVVAPAHVQQTTLLVQGPRTMVFHLSSTHNKTIKNRKITQYLTVDFTENSNDYVGQRILTNSRIAGGVFFQGGQCNVTTDDDQSAALSRLQQCDVMPLLIFLQRTTQQRLIVVFNGPVNPKKLPFPLGGSGPHLIYRSFLGPILVSPQTISRSRGSRK